MPVKLIKKNILRSNGDIACRIRLMLKDSNTLMVNLISSPGSGKTSLLERLGPELVDRGVSFAVLSGDCFTSEDARRMDRCGIEALQINTGNCCHIDAQLILKSLKEIDAGRRDLIVVENVGNLVCPAEFDVGEDYKVAMLSTAEGDEKPLKYPLLFRESEAVLINKIDLLGHTDFDLEKCEGNIKKINPDAVIFKVSCAKGTGLCHFAEWITDRLKHKSRSR